MGFGNTHTLEKYIEPIVLIKDLKCFEINSNLKGRKEIHAYWRLKNQFFIIWLNFYVLWKFYKKLLKRSNTFLCLWAILRFGLWNQNLGLGKIENFFREKKHITLSIYCLHMLFVFCKKKMLVDGEEERGRVPHEIMIFLHFQ